MNFIKQHWPKLIPTVIMFLSPWMHQAVYVNIKIAVPGVDETFARGFAIVSPVVAMAATVLIFVSNL